MYRLLTLIHMVLIMVFSTLYGCDFDPASVCLIPQQHQHNVLFKGGVPLSKSDSGGEMIFNYEGLINAFNQRLGFTLPEDVQLDVICLLNDSAESGYIDAERSFFERNPDKGTCSLHPIYGSFFNPHSISESIRESLLSKSRILDHLESAVQQIHQKLCQQDKVHIVYVHSNASDSHDREVLGSYLMRYENHTFEDAIQGNHSSANESKMTVESLNGLAWYAWKLYREGFDIQSIRGPYNAYNPCE